MRDSNHIDDFEEYLRDQVTEHRMYPSDRVWKNIRGRIHTPKKWPALSVFTVLIISGLVIGTILNKPVPDSVTPNFIYSLQSPSPNEDASNSGAIAKNDQPLVDNNYSVDQLTSSTITAAVEKINFNTKTVLHDLPFINDFSTPHLTSVSPTTDYVQNESVASTYLPKGIEKNNKTTSLVNKPFDNNSFASFRNIDAYLFDVTSRLKNILNTGPALYPTTGGGAAFFSQGRSRADFVYSGFDLKSSVENRDVLPSLNKLGKSSSRFDFRFYVAPSVSYRRLLENDENAKDNKEAGASLESDYRIEPSIAINQSPALGYETGLGLGYKLNRNFALTGGFQFNISQYKINAFLHTDEPAALILNDGNYSSIVNTTSSLRSIPGTTPLTIKNRYYQLSMPLGIEWLILNNRRFSWGLATSVQPTYTFDKQPLIMSSNYKNYADGSAYVRNWNINTSAETFLGYTTGSYRWQVGPQIRYQILPSLVNKYPNKEYLFNYGLKFGVVKQLK